MDIYSSYSDRLVSFFLYLFLTAALLAGGIKITNYYLDYRFYISFLAEWEMSINEHVLEGGGWPEFTGENHVAYMSQLTQLIKEKRISIPVTRWKKPFRYQINKVGKRRKNIMLLAFPNSIIVYGIDRDTFRRIDNLIDGRISAGEGKLRGYLDTNEKTYTATWLL